MRKHFFNYVFLLTIFIIILSLFRIPVSGNKLLISITFAPIMEEIIKIIFIFLSFRFILKFQNKAASTAILSILVIIVSASFGIYEHFVEYANETSLLFLERILAHVSFTFVGFILYAKLSNKNLGLICWISVSSVFHSVHNIAVLLYVNYVDLINLSTLSILIFVFLISRFHREYRNLII